LSDFVLFHKGATAVSCNSFSLFTELLKKNSNYSICFDNVYLQYLQLYSLLEARGFSVVKRVPMHPWKLRNVTENAVISFPFEISLTTDLHRGTHCRYKSGIKVFFYLKKKSVGFCELKVVSGPTTRTSNAEKTHPYKPWVCKQRACCLFILWAEAAVI